MVRTSMFDGLLVAERPARFDITSFDFEHAVEDESGMLKTVRLLNEIITNEIDAGIPANRIVLGGFSQGGAMSLLAGLTSERKLAGVVVMSGCLPLRNKFKAVSAYPRRVLEMSGLTLLV